MNRGVRFVIKQILLRKYDSDIAEKGLKATEAFMKKKYGGADWKLLHCEFGNVAEYVDKHQCQRIINRIKEAQEIYQQMIAPTGPCADLTQISSNHLTPGLQTPNLKEF